MQCSNDVALKEWKFTADRLRAADQIILLRKGGISEPKKTFEAGHREFFIFPTYLHQNPSAVGEAWAEPMRRAMAEPHDPSSVELQLYAVVDSIFRVDRLEALRSLVPLQSLNWTAIEQRFHYKGQPGLHVLLLRAHRLPAPRRIPNTKEYDGCRSWVKLDGPIETTGATPVLAETEFDRRAGEIRNLLGEFETGPRRA